MNFRKQEAVFYLGHLVGSVDGSFSDKEVEDLVCGSSYYRNEVLESLDKDLLLGSIKDGSLTKSSACDLLNDLDKSERIDIMGSLFFIVAADGNINDKEKGLFAELLVRLDVDADEAIEKWKEMR
jgi:uncharacterized tellurite resistance protein B-like protein